MKSVLSEPEDVLPRKMSIYNAFRSGKITKKEYDSYLTIGYSKNQQIIVGE